MFSEYAKRKLKFLENIVMSQRFFNLIIIIYFFKKWLYMHTQERQTLKNAYEIFDFLNNALFMGSRIAVDGTSLESGSSS
jgi:hypothetical protein